MNFLTRATAITKLGFTTVPLEGKRATYTPQGCINRSREQAQIDEWSQKFPDANAAICADENYVILESDDALTLQGHLRSLGAEIPSTFAQQARMNRPHWVFQRAEWTVGNATIPGVFEFKGDNQYVVGFGSLHPSGEAYIRLNDAKPLPFPLPLWEALMEMREARMGASNRASNFVTPGPVALIKKAVAAFPYNGDWEAFLAAEQVPEELVIGESERHFSLTSLAGTFRNAYPEEGPEERAERLCKVRDLFCVEGARVITEGEIDNIAKWAEKKTAAPKAPRVFIGHGNWNGHSTSDGKRLKTLSELRAERGAAKELPFLVPGLLPANLPHILPGDSGLGKTPLVAQIGVALALGVDFLSRAPIEPRRVLIADYESGGQVLSMVDTIAEFLGRSPDELNDYLTILDGSEWKASEVLSAADRWKADLVIVDALRGFNPDAEAKNAVAGQMIAELQRQGAGWLMVHHLRKDPAQEQAKRAKLDSEELKVMEWLNSAAGARALVNQTHTRIAVDHARTGSADLIVRPYIKGAGEAGRIYLTREFDDNGEPLGYSRTVGEALLSLNRSHQYNFVRGQTLTFGEVADKLKGAGLASRSTVKAFIDDCEQAGLVVKEGLARSNKSAAARYRFEKG